MHDAWYFSIGCLPDTTKQAIAEHLLNAHTGYQKDFEGIVDFMMRGKSTDGKETLSQIQKIDQRRNQDFTNVAPEMAKLLNYV